MSISSNEPDQNTVDASSSDESPENLSVQFYQIVPNLPSLKVADPTGLDTAPLRAAKYCEPFTSASAFGWYMFSPIDFSIKFDGSDVVWRTANDSKWYPLNQVELPGLADQVDQHAPAGAFHIRDLPFLTSLREPGLVQIWTGLVARSRAGVDLLVRPPANLARSKSYDVFEGIIETDWWFGPLLTNIRISTTDVPVVFRTRWPLAQIQPVMRALRDRSFLLETPIYDGLKHWDHNDWRALLSAIDLREPGEPGAYARKSRRRRRRRSIT